MIDKRGPTTDKRDARTVEIAQAVFFGALIALGPSIVLRLLDRVSSVDDLPGWAAIGRTVPVASVVLAALFILWRLILARRRGM